MAGTVWLKPKTLAAVVNDVVQSLYRQGFRKILILSAHGGNFVLRNDDGSIMTFERGDATLVPGSVVIDT